MTLNEKQIISIEAIKHLPKRGIVGIGSGSTVNIFLEELAKKSETEQLTFIPASLQTTFKIKSLKLQFSSFIPEKKIRIVFDGADYWTNDGILIKGGGGALYKEKLLFNNSEKIIVLAGGKKKVDKIGGKKMIIPIETSPFVAQRLMKILEKKYSAKVSLRTDKKNNPIITENSNVIIDTIFPYKIDDPIQFNTELKQQPEIICTGIFSNFSFTLITTEERKIQTYYFKRKS